MHSTRVATLLLVFSTIACCASQHNTDPSLPAGSQPKTAAAPDAPTPRDDLLDRLTGNWTLTRSFQGKAFHCEADGRWVIGDRWVRLDLKPPAEPPKPGHLPYEALVMIGYDANAREYIAYWHDTFGAQYGTPGRGKRKGDAVEFFFDDGNDSYTWNTFTYDRANDTWTSLIQNQDKGKDRRLFLQETYERR